MRMVIEPTSEVFADPVPGRVWIGRTETGAEFRVLVAGIWPSPGQPSITCPKCGLTSYHPSDIEHRFCRVCGYHAEGRP